MEAADDNDKKRLLSFYQSESDYKGKVEDVKFIFNKYGVDKMLLSEIEEYTDAALNDGIGGISSNGFYIQERFADCNKLWYNDQQRDILWKELSAIFCTLFALRAKCPDELMNKNITVFRIGL